MYVVGVTSDSIVPFVRDESTGDLTMGTPILDATNLDGARSVATSPDGKHVYAVAYTSDSIVPFVRDESTGDLTMGTLSLVHVLVVSSGLFGGTFMD